MIVLGERSGCANTYGVPNIVRSWGYRVNKTERAPVLQMPRPHSHTGRSHGVRYSVSLGVCRPSHLQESPKQIFLGVPDPARRERQPASRVQMLLGGRRARERSREGSVMVVEAAENAATSRHQPRPRGAADAKRGFHKSPHPAWLARLRGRASIYEPGGHSSVRGQGAWPGRGLDSQQRARRSQPIRDSRSSLTFPSLAPSPFLSETIYMGVIFLSPHPTHKMFPPQGLGGGREASLGKRFCSQKRLFP